MKRSVSHQGGGAAGKQVLFLFKKVHCFFGGIFLHLYLRGLGARSRQTVDCLLSTGADLQPSVSLIEYCGWWVEFLSSIPALSHNGEHGYEMHPALG